MTKDEFNAWFFDHASRFIGLNAYIAKQQDRNGQPMGQAILNAWLQSLQDVSFEEAKAASDEMFRLPEDQLPKGYDRHPAKILELTRNERRRRPPPAWKPRVIDGHETYKCPDCRDYGVFTVWHPDTIALIRKGYGQNMLADPRRHPAYTCAVRCVCEAGRCAAYMGDAHRAEKLATIDRFPELADLIEAVESEPVGFPEFLAFGTASEGTHARP